MFHRTQNLKTDFVTDLTIWNPYWHGFPIDQICDKFFVWLEIRRSRFVDDLNPDFPIESTPSCLELSLTSKPTLHSLIKKEKYVRSNWFKHESILRALLFLGYFLILINCCQFFFAFRLTRSLLWRKEKKWNYILVILTHDFSVNCIDRITEKGKIFLGLLS